MAEESVKARKVEKVIKGTAKPAQRTLGQKFTEIFLGDDISNVKEYLFYERIVPGIKEMILAGIEMMLFGGDRVIRRNTNPSKASYVSYNKMYASSASRREREARYERPTATSAQFTDYIFESKGEAMEVLDTLTELIDVYDQASVNDFYDAIGVTGDFTDANYGWTELGNATIRRVRGGGYILDLPRPVVLR